MDYPVRQTVFSTAASSDRIVNKIIQGTPSTPPSPNTPPYGNNLNENKEETKWYKNPIIVFLIGFIIGGVIIALIFYNGTKHNTVPLSEKDQRAEIERLTSENQALQAELLDTKTMLYENVDDTDLATLTTSKDKTIQNQKIEIEKLNGQLKTLSEKNQDTIDQQLIINEKDADIKELNSQIEALKKDKNDLNSKIKELETQINNQETPEPLPPSEENNEDSEW